MLLEDIRSFVKDPVEGMELVAAFYETDQGAIGHCDDSLGHVGMVFTHDARELFFEYAERYEDKEKVANIILNLNKEDNYGVRDSLIDVAGKKLPKKIVRKMIEQFQKWAAKDNKNKNHYLIQVQSLARQIKDPIIYEKAKKDHWGELSTAAFIDIAEVYFESGDVETAHSWVKKISEDETFKSYERNNLLHKIYVKKGDTQKLTDLLLKELRSNHSLRNLEKLLDVIGNDKKEKVLEDEVAFILESQGFRSDDADFLMKVGKIDEAENYIIERAEKLNGWYYNHLLPLAQSMVIENRNLAASLIYRALLISILERAQTKTYSHGVKYLIKLDGMAKTIKDWKNHENHMVFFEKIVEKHGRKRSFWSKYEEKK